MLCASPQLVREIRSGEGSIGAARQPSSTTTFARSWAPACPPKNGLQVHSEMANLVPLMILVVMFSANFLVREIEGLPSQFMYAPDMAIALASMAVVIRLTANSRWSTIPLKYILTFSGFAYVVVAGIIVNDVGEDTVIAGIRTYFRFVPIFLIPFAFAFTRRDLRIQIKFLVLVLAVQVPVTIWQRFFEYKHIVSGDIISGTLASTSSVSILSSGAIVYVASQYIDRRLSALSAMSLTLVFLIPAALSETKATPIFMAVGALAAIWLRRHSLSFRKLIAIGAATVIALTLFSSVYDQLYPGRGGVFGQLTDSHRVLDSYNMTGVETAPLEIAREETSTLVGFPKRLREEEKNVGRIDSVRLPFEALYPDETLRLFIGLGTGNVGSTFGSGGDYRFLYNELGATSTTIAMLIWETGLVGTVFFVVFLAFLGLDAWRLSKVGGFLGGLASAHFSVTAVVGLGLIYANLFHHPEVLALYIYFSAVLVCQGVLDRKADSPVSIESLELGVPTGGDRQSSAMPK